MDRPNTDRIMEQQHPRQTGVAYCEFCREKITNLNTAYRKVTGWEAKRKVGGTNAIRLRVPSHEWACTWCIEKESKKVNANQGGLFV